MKDVEELNTFSMVLLRVLSIESNEWRYIYEQNT